MRFEIQTKYQDGCWETVKTTLDKKRALGLAKKYSKDAICYGMVRVVDTVEGKILVTHPAGGTMIKKVYITGCLQASISHLDGKRELVLADVEMGDVDFRDIHEGKVTIIAEVCPKILAPSDAEWLTSEDGSVHLKVGQKLLAVVGPAGSWRMVDPCFGLSKANSQSQGKKRVVEYLARQRIYG